MKVLKLRGNPDLITLSPVSRVGADGSPEVSFEQLNDPLIDGGSVHESDGAVGRRRGHVIIGRNKANGVDGIGAT